MNADARPAAMDISIAGWFVIGMSLESLQRPDAPGRLFEPTKRGAQYPIAVSAGIAKDGCGWNTISHPGLPDCMESRWYL